MPRPTPLEKEIREGAKKYAREEVARLAKQLESEDFSKRMDAVKYLAYMPKAEAASLILKTAATDPDRLVRGQAEESMENRFLEHGWPRVAMPVMAKALEDPDSNIRRVAVKGLSWTYLPQAIRHITKALSDKDEKVRFTAAHALGEVAKMMKKERDSHRIIAPLKRALREDPAVAVRNAAAFELGRLAHAKIIPILARALNDPVEQVRYHAIDALATVGRLNDRKNRYLVLPHLARALQQKPGAARRQAEQSVKQILTQNGDILPKLAANPKPVKWVTPYFNENENPRVVRQALLAAVEGRIKPSNARLYVKQLRAMRGSLK